MNDYRVSLLWFHPRYQYSKLIAEEASNRAKQLETYESPLEGLTPNYRKMGRSRKRIVSYTAKPISDAMLKYIDFVDATKLEVGNTVGFEIRPSMEIKWHMSSKSMLLCAPFEVRNSDDLKKGLDDSQWVS